MLEVVSVSLGSPARDHEARLTVAGARFRVRRLGTGGDLARAAALLRELDGRVHALGLGGANRALLLDGRAYPLPAGEWLAAQARRTPVADGARWKAAVEPEALRRLAREGFPLTGRTVGLTSILDRPALAPALAELGCRVRVGDALYALGLPFWFPSPRSFAAVARLTLPVLRRLPLRRLYPLGDRQERVRGAPARLFSGIDVLAGDFHFLRHRLPPSLRGRAVIAGSLTAGDLALLRGRGATAVATFVPAVEGRAFGANVWEAMAAAACRRPPEEIGAAELAAFWREAGGPSIPVLN